MSETDRCLVLASGSPRRLDLLGQITNAFKVLVSGVPEPVDESLSPAENVLAIAVSKAEAVAALASNCLVLAADTDVVLDGEILGKPTGGDDAASMLRRLRGRDHEVLTAVVVFDTISASRYQEVVRSVVHIRDLTDSEIAAYVATGEPLDKAGGYAIQGEAASMVVQVDGCYTNVVGLPVCATVRLLRAAGMHLGPDFACRGHEETD